MREFRGQVTESIYEIAGQLVAEVKNQGERMFSNLNGTILVADPEEAKINPRYADELIWTLWMAHHQVELIGRQTSYSNIVPRMRDLAGKLLPVLRQLGPTTETRYLIELLVWLTPITWCPLIWTEEERQRLIAKLASWPAYADWASLRSSEMYVANNVAQGTVLVKRAIASLTYRYLLNESWHKDAVEWLKG